MIITEDFSCTHIAMPLYHDVLEKNVHTLKALSDGKRWSINRLGEDGRKPLPDATSESNVAICDRGVRKLLRVFFCATKMLERVLENQQLQKHNNPFWFFIHGAYKKLPTEACR